MSGTNQSEPTKYQAELLHHTLGLRPDHRQSYRNHFVAGHGHHAQADLEALVALGLMRRVRPPTFLSKGDEVFVVTEAGRKVAFDTLPRPAPVPRDKARFLDWLSYDNALSFGEYLRRRLYQTMERPI